MDGKAQGGLIRGLFVNVRGPNKALASVQSRNRLFAFAFNQ